MSRRGNTIEDIYSAAQFGSLWKVVVHATEAKPGEDEEELLQRRLDLLHGEAAQSMMLTGKWRGYRKQYSPKKRLHVGFRFANPKDWFILTAEGEVEGPFQSKNIIKSKLRVKRTTYIAAGIYTAHAEDTDYTLFTRDRAADVDQNEEELP